MCRSTYEYQDTKQCVERQVWWILFPSAEPYKIPDTWVHTHRIQMTYPQSCVLGLCRINTALKCKIRSNSWYVYSVLKPNARHNAVQLMQGPDAHHRCSHRNNLAQKCMTRSYFWYINAGRINSAPQMQNKLRSQVYLHLQNQFCKTKTESEGH